MSPLESWGRYPRVHEQRVHPIAWQDAPLPDSQGGSLLPYGQGRSYGDCCLNEGGTLLATARLDRFLAFDTATGVLRCEAGVTLDEILRLAVPQGWFLPVTPGTRFVSVGGAIANDVHGKNHHRAGTFGRHVLRFMLLRSDGQRFSCSPTENAELYAATIGGLGLTGLVLWAEVQLRRIANPYLLAQTLPSRNLEHFFELSAASDAGFEYTVAWVDCLARGKHLGRGLFFRGNHAPPQLDSHRPPRHPPRRSRLAVPFDLPSFALNPLTMGAFNFLYYHVHRRQAGEQLVHYQPFFYPLDAIHDWNRIYGRRGFLQFQCVVPFDGGDGAIRSILEEIARSRRGSFLAVLKTFGHVPSPGWMSFPRPGVTLALDFPNRGEPTYRLFATLEELAREHGGALYPAKDARMAPETFAASFPRRERFARCLDPAFSSSFWRRVQGAPR